MTAVFSAIVAFISCESVLMYQKRRRHMAMGKPTCEIREIACSIVAPFDSLVELECGLRVWRPYPIYVKYSIVGGDLQWCF